LNYNLTKMKKLIIVLIILVCSPAVFAEKQPFAPKPKSSYSKHKTKKYKNCKKKLFNTKTCWK